MRKRRRLARARRTSHYKRGKGDLAAPLLRRTISWLPIGADSNAAIVFELRAELRRAQSGDRAHAVPNPA